MFKNDKKTSFYKETKIPLDDASFLQLFSILKNEKNEKMLNIWRNYSLLYNPDALSYYEVYLVKDNDWWENISYEIYGSVKYWWILAILNNVENPFESLVPGSTLYLLRKEYIYTILKDIKNLRDL